MKNDVTDKSIMRRYLDDMYTQEEARGLLSRLKDDIHAPMLDELATDVWKEAAKEELTTGMEREKDNTVPNIIRLRKMSGEIL